MCFYHLQLFDWLKLIYFGHKGEPVKISVFICYVNISFW